MVTGKKIVDRCRAFGGGVYSETQNGLFRPWLSDAFFAAQKTLSEWMTAAGMHVRYDAAGNLIGRYEACVPGRAAVLLGSHIDSVANGGCFDGLLGVVLAISVVEQLFQADKRYPFAIEIIAFGDEEGSAFPVSMITSRAVSGEVKPEDWDLRGPSGSVAETMQARGLFCTDLLKAGRSEEDIIAFVEAHIEQGPVLEAIERPLAAVRSIAAQRRGTVTIKGQAGHAGTLPMAMRRDALAAAAEAVLSVERIVSEFSGGAEGGLVGTVGRLNVSPGGSNVVADHVDFSLDVRSGGRDLRDAAIQDIEAEFHALAQRRGVTLSCVWQQDLEGAECDPSLVELMQQAACAEGGSDMALVSGAGHDAMVMARRWPTVMLFIRSPGGISHHPDETVLEDDVDAAHRTLLGFLERLKLSQKN
ncbi:allantoate amidohydrolase [Neokomagataea anthophila]|uniref:Allantoate amidohydrolase n=1 Tax=Neokomagataea anthophila TaxID=2826925 RepID=A0ABS5E948_9PROT|nr:allantoate amidohydrolase [Neokomagataea anthophila]MBR0560429.1 allantoate amidohydrolase [Neokomagataea anthophila]